MRDLRFIYYGCGINKSFSEGLILNKLWFLVSWFVNWFMEVCVIIYVIFY